VPYYETAKCGGSRCGKRYFKYAYVHCGYYRALRASQKLIRSEGENLYDWQRFFLTSLKKRKDALLGKIEREQLLEKLAPLEEKMLAIAWERGRITIANAVTLLAGNRNTVKLHLRQLVQLGYLEQHGTGKGTWYSVGRYSEGGRWLPFELSIVSP
jgi:predicted HTH transcriptional regulator